MSDAQESAPAEAQTEVVASGAVEAAPEAAPVEAAPEAEKPAPKVEAAPETDTKFAAKFAALARREKALKQKEKQIEEKLKAAQNVAQPAAAPAAVAKAPIEQRLLEDPFNTLKELGVGYDKLTEMALNDGRLSPDLQIKLVEQKLRQEMEEKYGKKISEYEQRLQDEAKAVEAQKEQQAIQTFKSNITKLIADNKGEYELLAVEGEEGADLVYEVIDQHYQATGEILDTKVASQLVEESLFEDLKKKLELQKIKSTISAQSAPPKPVPQTKPTVTLTNTASQVSTPSVKRRLSDDESKAEAAKLIRWIEE